MKSMSRSTSMSRGTVSRRTLVAIAVAALAFAVLTSGGLAASPKFGGTLRVAQGAAPPTLDWQWSTTNATRQVAANIFEGLVAYNERFEIVPMLAESWSISADKLTYTFKLRRGVLFHNGQEMTSGDVKASLERWMKVSPRRSDLEDLKEIRAVDKYTVQFVLQKKFGGFLAVLGIPSAYAVIMPAEIAKDSPGGKLKEVVGTGPFKFADWIPDRYIKLVKFDKYKPVSTPPGGFAGRKVAYVNEIQFLPVPEDSVRVAGLETGEFDIIDPVPNVEYGRLSKSTNIGIDIVKPKWMILSYFNTKMAPMSDVRMRRAILAAIDPDAVMEAASGDKRFYRMDGSIFYQEQVWHSSAGTEAYNHPDPAKAKALLKEAGYKGQPIRVLTTKSYDWMYKAALVVQQQLMAVGVNVDLQILDWPTLVSTRTNPAKWEIYFTGISVFFDPLNYTQAFRGNYPGWYRSDDMDKALDTIMTEDDMRDRYKAVEEMQRIYWRDLPSLNFGNYFELRGHRSYVHGTSSFVELVLWNTWLEK